MKLPALLAAALLAAAASGQTNSLTPAEKAAGWILLFDGASMKGWSDPRLHNPPGDSWSIDDACLKSKSKPRIREDLFTTESFRDFELVFDWRISKAGNSGVKYRIQDHWNVGPAAPGERFEASVQRAFENRAARPAPGGQDYVIGFEYQIADDAANPDAGSDARHATAALYDIAPPSTRPTRPVGEFNTSRIVLRANRVEHWLNGVKVVDAALDGPDAIAAIGKRWSPAPAVVKLLSSQPRQSCPISLQNHNDEAWFRNIKIRRL